MVHKFEEYINEGFFKDREDKLVEEISNTCAKLFFSSTHDFPDNFSKIIANLVYEIKNKKEDIKWLYKALELAQTQL